MGHCPPVDGPGSIGTRAPLSLTPNYNGTSPTQGFKINTDWNVAQYVVNRCLRQNLICHGV
eukprot:7104884-Lingulodinium_polyedra.AAC.1